MPYIKIKDRKKYDILIDTMRDILKNEDNDSIEGSLNYVITNLLFSLCSIDNTRYYMVNRAMGVLECVKQEFYRRLAAPYEDKKVKENGDVFC